MGKAGPGAAIQNDVSPEPTLQGADQFEYVTILNPLTDDFYVMVAQDVPVNVPFEIHKDNTGRTSTVTNTEQDARQVYGLSLKNPDHAARKRIYNTAVIPSGRTMNFRGDDAQVVVRQLVNEIMQREDNKRFLADPVKRKEVEDRIIKSRSTIDFNSLRGMRDQVNDVIQNANEVNNAQFPGLVPRDQETPEVSGNTEDPDPAPAKRATSRPAKS